MKDEYLEDEGKVVLVKKEGGSNRPIKAQDCFTRIKPPRGRPSLKLNSIGLFVVQTLASFRCPEEEIAAGHGGMDTLMLRDFFDAAANGREMPIDVYDAASWMVISCLSEQSVQNNGRPVDIPDFTGGEWLLRR